MSLPLLRQLHQAPVRRMLNTFGGKSLFDQAHHRVKLLSTSKHHLSRQTPLPFRSRISPKSVSSRSTKENASPSLPSRLRASKAIIWAFISLNTAVFVAWQVGSTDRYRKFGNSLQEIFALSVTGIQNGRLHTLITSAFSHMGLGHFVFNMVTFYTFATGLTAVAGLGPSQLVTLSLLAAFGGSIAWVGERIYWERQHVAARTHFRDASAMGASGLVMGLSSALTCLTPFLPMSVMFSPFPIPLWVVTGFIAAFDVYFMDENAVVGHAAHLGGAVVGVMYYGFFLRKLGGVSSILWRRTW